MKKNYSTKNAGNERMCSYTDVVDNLAFYLPENQAVFKGSKPYLQLCDAVFAVLKASTDDRPMFQQALKHARNVFVDFCDFENRETFKKTEEEKVKREEVLVIAQKKEDKNENAKYWWSSI